MTKKYKVRYSALLGAWVIGRDGETLTETDGRPAEFKSEKAAQAACDRLNSGKLWYR